MSDTKSELTVLLKSIQDGLKHFTISEMTCAINAMLAKKGDKSVEVNHVIEVVCEHFQLTKRVLKSKGGRGEVQEAKQLAYCLLHFELKLSLRYIAKRIFMNNHNSVANGVRRLKTANPKVKVDKEFVTNYEHLQSLLYARLNKKEST